MFALMFCLGLVIMSSIGWCADGGGDRDRLDVASLTKANKENVAQDSLQPEEIKFNFESTPASFPHHEINGIYEAYGGGFNVHGSWALTTRKTMRSLAQCAREGDSIALLYLAHAFDHTRSATKECFMTKNLYKSAFHALSARAEQTTNLETRAKARFIIAKELKALVYVKPLDDGMSGTDFSFKYLESLETREAILLRNLLRLKDKLDPQPTLGDFLHAEDLRMHPWALLRALEYTNQGYIPQLATFGAALQIYKHPAYLVSRAGIFEEFYKLKKNPSHKEQCLNLFQEAGDLGHPQAYMKMVSLLVPYDTQSGHFDFSKASSDELEVCKGYLEKATRQLMPGAFYNLALCIHEIHQRTPEAQFSERESLWTQMIKYFKQAAQ